MNKLVTAALLLASAIPATSAFAACPTSFVGPIVTVATIGDFDGDNLADKLVNAVGATPVAVGSRLALTVKNGVDGLVPGVNFKSTLLGTEQTSGACLAVRAEVGRLSSSVNRPARTRNGTVGGG